MVPFTSSRPLSQPEFSEEELIADICRESYEEFVREFWAEVPGVGPLQWNWHLSVLCRKMQEHAERVFRNEPCTATGVFNVPFGTSKSSVCYILFLPWTWTRMASARHLNATHTHDLTLELAGKSRAVLNSDKYKACFP